MPKTARSAFVIDHKEGQPAKWEGGQMGHNRFEKTFTGELTGKSVVEAVMLMPADGLPAVYVGIERFDCTLAGRAGTFLLLHSAIMQGERREGTWSIVAGSGTGALVGIRGSGEILPDHEFTLSYELD